MKRLLIAMLLCFLFALAVPAQAQDDGPHLYIPAIELSEAVGEIPLAGDTYDMDAIGDGVGHLEGTTWIDDDWGRVVLAGHTPGVFSDLTRIIVGDVIVVYNPITVYRVVYIDIVPVSAVEWVMPTTEPTLTLITCSGDDRLVIHAIREF